MTRWLTNTAVLAIAYFVAGRVGQLLAAPPNYSTAVWPASGIALAGLLLYGYRVWPGLFLGAFLVNAWTPLTQADNFNEIAMAMTIASSIGFGATLQAVVAKLLIERFVGSSSSLTREREILGFLSLGGPVACLVGASWGVLTLFVTARIEATHIMMNWWTWWVGDVIGVIIFAPLMLICFAQPRDVWRSRRISVALPLCVGCAMTIIGFMYAQLNEQSHAQIEFESRASKATKEIQKQIDGHLDAVHSLKSLFASSPIVDREGFSTFNRHLLSRHVGMQAMEWLPRVTRQQRSEYEARARLEGISGFVITERDADNQLTEAGEREEYYPVFFVEPLASNEAALGFDVASNPERREALNRACDTGQQVATGPITLVQETSGQTGCVVFDPFYSRDMSVANMPTRRLALEGYALGVFRVGDIVHASYHDGLPQDFHLTIVDIAAAPEKRVIYSAGDKRSPHKSTEVAPILRGYRGRSTTIDVAGRKWRCEFAPTATFLANHASQHTWKVLASGLSFTGLLGTFLLILAGRASQVEELVTDRTDKLSKVNQDLASEITVRQEFEIALTEAHEILEQRVLERTAELKASEARYLDLYDNAPDMFISVDIASRRVIECNETFLKVTGFSRSEIIDRHVYDLYHPDCLDDARQSLGEFLSTGNTQGLELLLLRVDGGVIDVSLNVSTVQDEEGCLLYSRAVLRDITAKKLAEAQVKIQETELAHVARLSTMGEMATGLSHEINQPLAAIAAYAEGAAMRLRNGDVDEARLAQVVDRISADAHRAGEVIRRLRKFVQKREPDRKQVDLNEIVMDVVQFISTDARQRDVLIGFDLEEDLPSIRADSIEIQQVLLNLILNGCDSMQETDPVDRRLMIYTRSGEKETIEVDVEDRGHGMSEGMAEQVFEAFFTSKKEGLGMGLAISRSIIESHGGRIWATQNAEGGATFHISLPFA
jgi:PAS domain S-box-containing protein